MPLLFFVHHSVKNGKSTDNSVIAPRVRGTQRRGEHAKRTRNALGYLPRGIFGLLVTAAPAPEAAPAPTVARHYSELSGGFPET